jgi:hypothetical protein
MYNNNPKKYFKNKSNPYFTGVIFLLIIFFGLFGLAGISQAADYYVSPTGAATWANCGAPAKNGTAACSWQTAMANTVADDVVYFRGGTYNVEASCSGSWEYIAMKPTHGGTAGHPITFIAYPGETPVVTPCTAAPQSPAFGARDVDYIIWDGFSGTMIDGPGEVWYFVYWNSDHSIVRNMNILGQTHTGGDHHNNCAPIRIDYSDSVEIYNNNLRCVGGDAYTVNSSCIWFFTVINSKVHNNYLYGGSNGFEQKLGVNEYNEIYNNFLYNLTHDGIMLNESAVTGTGHKVYQNVLSGIGGTGVSIYLTSPLSRQVDYQIYNNTIYGAGEGIQSSDTARNAQIWNNIISGGANPFLRYYTGDAMPSYSDYNDFYGSGYWDLDYTAYYYSLSNWRTATSLDANSIITNPNFVNAGGALVTDYKRTSYPTNGRGGAYASVMGAYITGNEVIGYTAPESSDTTPPAAPTGLSVQ